MNWLVLQGDARAMPLPDASVDAIVCDPPYGLEFMGKEWDKLVPEKPKMTATEACDHMKDGSFGPWGRRKRPINPNTYGHRNERCLECRKWRVSSNPCKCESPRWEYRTRQAAPHAMIAMQRWHETWAHEALRVLKPGGHLLAAGIGRTHHRLMCAVEDAGFELRDCLYHIFGSGFPKSLSLSKAIDKAAGAKRKVTDEQRMMHTPTDGGNYDDDGYDWGAKYQPITAPATDAAKQWDGWGTALKPAVEVWVLARKPLIGTVAQNVLTHGVGALNIDGCRVGTGGDTVTFERSAGERSREQYRTGTTANAQLSGKGRWPPNLLLSHAPGCRQVGTRRVAAGNSNQGVEHGSGDGVTYLTKKESGAHYADADGKEVVAAWICQPGCAVAELDRQSGERSSCGTYKRGAFAEGAWLHAKDAGTVQLGYGDSGTASRFYPQFQYVPKASRGEREAGLERLPKNPGGSNAKGYTEDVARGLDRNRPVGNHHPTVKPIDLMRWLIRLVTPPGGLVLDPFCGSGSTGCAAMQERFRFIGLDLEPEYLRIAAARIRHWTPRQVDLFMDSTSEGAA